MATSKLAQQIVESLLDEAFDMHSHDRAMDYLSRTGGSRGGPPEKVPAADPDYQKLAVEVLVSLKQGMSPLSAANQAKYLLKTKQFDLDKEKKVALALAKSPKYADEVSSFDVEDTLKYIKSFS